MEEKRFEGAGGTQGGVGFFLLGLLLAAVGLYMLFQQVQVSSGFWHFYGVNAFGPSLIPLLVGIGILFFNGESVLGWGLTLVGLAIILAGILMNLEIYFRTTSLYNTLIMLGSIAAGFGLIAKSLRPATKGK